MNDKIEAIQKRFLEIANLKPGWFDEDSPSFDKEKLDWVEKILISMQEINPTSEFYVYPTPTGDIRVELTFENDDVSIIFDLFTHKIYLVYLESELNKTRTIEMVIEDEPAAAVAWLLTRTIQAFHVEHIEKNKESK